MKYYFLSCTLPQLNIDHKVDISLEEIEALFSINLSIKDLEKINILRSYYDINNLLAFWQEKEIDNRGTLDEKGIEEAMLVQNFFPEYVFEYVRRYEELHEKIRNFSFILMNFFNDQIEKNEGFLKEYFLFEKQCRLIITFLRSKKLKKDFLDEVKYEDEKDFFLMEILKQKEMENYEPPREYAKLKDIFIKYQAHPNEMQKEFLKFKLKRIDEMIETKNFTIDEILGYLAKFFIILEWQILDTNVSQVLVDKLA